LYLDGGGRARTNVLTTNPVITALINRCNSANDNNSPYFKSVPNFRATAGSDFVTAGSVYDFDTLPNGQFKDSIVIERSSPFGRDTFVGTAWRNGHSLNAPIDFNGFPKYNLPYPRGIQFDAELGDYYFRPLNKDSTYLKIRAYNYRNGVLLGWAEREHLVYVDSSGNNLPKVSGIDGFQFSPYKGNKTTVCGGDKVSFTLEALDNDKADTVSLSWDGGLKGARFTSLGFTKGKESAQFEWQTDTLQIQKRPFTFSVNAKDNHCPYYGETSRSYSIQVVETYDVKRDYQQQGCGNLKIESTLGNNQKVHNINWSIDDTTYSVRNFTHHFKSGGQKIIKCTVTSKEGCTKQFTDTVFIDTFVNLIATGFDTMLCAGNHILEPKVSSYNIDYNITWNGLGAVDSNRFFIDRDTILAFEIRDSAKCRAFDTVFVNVYPIIDVKINSSINHCINDGNVNLSAKPTGGVWEGPGISDSTIWVDSLAEGSYQYFYAITDTNGCVYGDKTKLTLVEPIPLTITRDTQLCENTDSILLEAEPKGGQWTGIGLFNSDGKNYFKSNFSGVGEFNLVYYYDNKNGCISRDTFGVEVFKTPIAKFSLDTNKGFVPFSVQIKDETQGANNWQWYILPGDSIFSISKEPELILTDTGEYKIWLVALDTQTNCFTVSPKVEAFGILPTTSFNLNTIDVELIPNPTDGLVKIDGLLIDDKVVIFNSTGQLMSDISIVGEGFLDLRPCSDGLYVMFILRGNTSKQYKLILRRN
jgi:PKD repeat protein